MAWRIAESLEKLRKQLNALYPNRSKASDGGIGDAAHASRSSDHNPWFKDSKGIGIVTARDFTHDPANGLDCHKLAQTLIESRDPRIKYIIWNKQILSSKQQPWKWRPYSGINAHKHHLHISVMPEAKFYDDASDWNLSPASTPNIPASVPTPATAEQSADFYVVKAGDTASGIARRFGLELLQLKRLNNLNDKFEIRAGDKLKVK